MFRNVSTPFLTEIDTWRQFHKQAHYHPLRLIASTRCDRLWLATTKSNCFGPAVISPEWLRAEWQIHCHQSLSLLPVPRRPPGLFSSLPKPAVAAVSLAERYREAGLVVELHDLRDYRPKALARVENALFVVATHGIGEAPDGTEMFFEFWLSDKAPRLEKLNYSILALGDSSYVDYCEMGRVFDERLRQLGATPVVDTVECDLDYETSAADWTHQVEDHAATNSAANPCERQLFKAFDPKFDRIGPDGACCQKECHLKWRK